MRHAAVLVELEGTHKLLPLDDDEVLYSIHIVSRIYFTHVFFRAE